MIDIVQELDSDIKSKVKGVVPFGFTHNLQDHGQVPDYPKGQIKVFCAPRRHGLHGHVDHHGSTFDVGPACWRGASYLSSKVQG